MANGLLDLLGGAIGTTPPAYLEGLLGQGAVEDLRKRSLGSGLVNALVGYAAMPKNQNLGLGRILAGAAQAGMQGAQGVYDTATQDYMQAQKIAEMKRQQEKQQQLEKVLGGITDPTERLFAQLSPEQYVSAKLKPTARKTFVAPDGSIRFEDTGEIALAQNVSAPKPRPTQIAPNGQLIYTDTGEPVTNRSFAAPVKPNEPPTSIQEYEYAKKQGYSGPYKQFQEEIKKAGATSINMPSESERTAGFLTSRLQNALGQIKQVVTKNPNAASPKIGAEAVQFLTGSDYLKNLTNPETRQQVESAQLELLDSALTLGTGAAYTREQLQNYSKSYFPQLGDKPANIADKKKRLEALLKSAYIKAGRSSPETTNSPKSKEDILKFYGVNDGE